MKLPFLTLKEDPPGNALSGSPLAGSEDPSFVEQFKALRAKFEYRSEMLNYRVVAVTSAIAGEGKSLSAMNLAANLASVGRKRVLLVDVDLRKSELAKRMQIAPLPGLSEYLFGSVGLNDIVRNSFASGLYVIPSGMRVASPGDILAGDRIRSVLMDLRNQFDVVLLDTPPILAVSDTLSLRDLVDGFIFIYRVGFTPHEMFRQAVEEIGEKKILGVVLNGVERRSDRYYHRYYGKYYRKPGAQ